MNQEKPELIKDGIQFWPIPATDKASIVFGVDQSHYFHRRKLPNVPRQYIDAASKLFFDGGKPTLGEDVDWSVAKDWLRSRLCSYAPAHESKEATVGYALWVWSPECSDVRAQSPETKGNK